MRRFFLFVAAAIVFLAAPASAGPFVLIGVVSNDTGVIIPWSAENQRFRHEIASAHRARRGKYARITSVHAQYGDYIGFVCRWYLPGYVPRYTRPVVVSRRPAVPVTK